MRTSSSYFFNANLDINREECQELLDIVVSSQVHHDKPFRNELLDFLKKTLNKVSELPIK